MNINFEEKKIMIAELQRVNHFCQKWSILFHEILVNRDILQLTREMSRMTKEMAASSKSTIRILNTLGKEKLHTFTKGDFRKMQILINSGYEELLREYLATINYVLVPETVTYIKTMIFVLKNTNLNIFHNKNKPEDEKFDVLFMKTSKDRRNKTLAVFNERPSKKHERFKVVKIRSNEIVKNLTTFDSILNLNQELKKEVQ